MTERTGISEAEWAVMKVLWQKSPATANEIVDKLSSTKPWKPKTVRTLINRLGAKKIITYDKSGREYLYKPLISEADCIRKETRSFLARAGTAALKPILAAFIEEQKLSKKEIEQLKDILDRKGDS